MSLPGVNLAFFILWCSLFGRFCMVLVPSSYRLSVINSCLSVVQREQTLLRLLRFKLLIVFTFWHLILGT